MHGKGTQVSLVFPLFLLSYVILVIEIEKKKYFSLNRNMVSKIPLQHKYNFCIPMKYLNFTIREFTIHVICKRNFFQIFNNHSTFISYFPPLHFKVGTWRKTMWWNQINGLLWQMNFSISVVYVLLLKLYFDDYHLNLTFSLCLSLKGGEESNRK